MLILLFNSSTGDVIIVPIPTSFDSNEGWWVDLVGVIQDTWPELTGIYRTQSLNRSSWELLVKQNKLTPPFCVIETLPQKEEGWGRDNFVYRQPLNIWYVSNTQSASAVYGGGYDITRYTLGRAQQMKLALATHSGSGFQMAGDNPTCDVSHLSAANEIFYKMQSQFFSSLTQASLLFGDWNGNGDLN